MSEAENTGRNYRTPEEEKRMDSSDKSSGYG
jgi:hypothetical protein